MRTAKTLGFVAACVGAAAVSIPAQAWEPTKPIEIIVPAGTGGGADQMARVMQGIITKHNLSSNRSSSSTSQAAPAARASSTPRTRRAIRTS